MCYVKLFLTFASLGLVLLQNQSTTENCENHNDPDLVQAFLKKWWVESDFKAPNLPLSLRLKAIGNFVITLIYQQYFIYTATASFIDGGNHSSRRNLQTCMVVGLFPVVCSRAHVLFTLFVFANA
jgi:hypothetical protein